MDFALLSASDDHTTIPDGTLCGHLKTVGNPDGVDALVQEVLGLLQQSPATLISSYCPF
jgi:hypothetical protein